MRINMQVFILAKSGTQFNSTFSVNSNMVVNIWLYLKVVGIQAWFKKNHWHHARYSRQGQTMWKLPG